MARPLRILFPDAYYHVTCRGNERKPIYRVKSGGVRLSYWCVQMNFCRDP
jgi:mRNA-degrading endonuclease RelE of RelBE toxin-antitoxin system